MLTAKRLRVAPKISVILATQNGERYIERAVQSILNQTEKDFELLLFDDGSTDSTPVLLKKMANLDSRMRIITHSKGMGLANTLNEGLALAQGEWIARMDHDDYSVPDRFERQLDFLKKNPETVILGSAVKNLGLGYWSQATYPSSADEVWAEMFFACPFAHPSVMYKREKFLQYELNYNSAFEKAEDYELWSRVLEAFPGANLNQPLLHYQNHPGQTRVAHSVVQASRLGPIWKNIFMRHGFDLTPLQLASHSWLCSEGRWSTPSSEELRELLEWVKTLASAPWTACSEPQKRAFKENLACRLLRIQAFFKFKNSELVKAMRSIEELPKVRLEFTVSIKTLLKGLLR